MQDNTWAGVVIKFGRSQKCFAHQLLLPSINSVHIFTSMRQMFPPCLEETGMVGMRWKQVRCLSFLFWKCVLSL